MWATKGRRANKGEEGQQHIAKYDSQAGLGLTLQVGSIYNLHLPQVPPPSSTSTTSNFHEMAPISRLCPDLFSFFSHYALLSICILKCQLITAEYIPSNRPSSLARIRAVTSSRKIGPQMMERPVFIFHFEALY